MVMIVVMRNKLMMLFMALGMIEIFGGPTTAVVMVQVWRCRMRVCVRMQMLRRLVGVRLPEHWRQQCRSAPSTLVAVASVAGSGTLRGGAVTFIAVKACSHCRSEPGGHHRSGIKPRSHRRP